MHPSSNSLTVLTYCPVVSPCNADMDILSTTIRRILITLSRCPSAIPLRGWNTRSLTFVFVSTTMNQGEDCLRHWIILRLLIRRTSSFVVQTGSGKDRSILMHYRSSPTGSEIKIRPYWVTRKHCTSKKYETRSLFSCRNSFETGNREMSPTDRTHYLTAIQLWSLIKIPTYR